MMLQQFFVPADAAGQRVDWFLARCLAAMEPPQSVSRAAVQRLIVEGQVTLNGATLKSSARLKASDMIEVQTPPVRETALVAEALPLAILHEDDDLIVVDKAVGMVVHPAAGRFSGTLVNAILYHCPAIAGIGGERRPGIVHRLDKDTSGVMVVAKNDLAMQSLVGQFKSRRVGKEYLALIHGRIERDQGIIDRSIGRHQTDRKRMSSLRVTGKSREAVTEWFVEGRFQIAGGSKGGAWCCLIRLVPRTGRTHQLRVHLADLGFPMIGDMVYGRKRVGGGGLPSQVAANEFPRQALHAHKLSFDHVRSGQRLEFCSPLPSDMRSLIEVLEHQSSSATAVDGTDKGIRVDKKRGLK